MAGYVYHLRPKSNGYFCKIGMTNGRTAEERVKELNSQMYGGFNDWEVTESLIVENPSDLERLLHEKFSDRLVNLDSEKEMFSVSQKVVEGAFEKYKTVPVIKYLSLKSKYEELLLTHEALKLSIESLKCTNESLSFANESLVIENEKQVHTNKMLYHSHETRLSDNKAIQIELEKAQKKSRHLMSLYKMGEY